LHGLWWGSLVSLALFYIWRDVPRYMHHSAASYGEYWTRKSSILLHVFPAALAFLLGFTQFSGRLRSQRPQIHRVAGRIYLMGTLVGAPAAMLLGSRSSCLLCRPPLVTLGGLWLLTTGIALVAIRLRDIATHRAFMIRSFGLMNVFSLIRLSEPLTFGLRPAESRVIREWSCLVLLVLGLELVLTWWPAWRRLHRPGRISRPEFQAPGSEATAA
jgi:hypothetical protein